MIIKNRVASATIEKFLSIQLSLRDRGLILADRALKDTAKFIKSLRDK